jgi:hypothetical protein
VASVSVYPTQNLDQWKGECICFPRSGLGAGKNIPSVENHGNGLGLNQGGDGVTLSLNGIKQFGPKAQSIK